MSLISVDTSTCPVCGDTGSMEVDSDRYDRWKSGGVALQDAFPDLAPPQREQLKTGYHPQCWKDMFGF